MKSTSSKEAISGVDRLLSLNRKLAPETAIAVSRVLLLKKERKGVFPKFFANRFMIISLIFEVNILQRPKVAFPFL